MEAEVGADGGLRIRQDMATQVHVEVLCGQVFAPLQEEPDMVAADGEARTLQGCGDILDGSIAIAHGNRYVEELRLYINRGVRRGGREAGEALAHSLQIEVAHSLTHGLQVLRAGGGHQRMRRQGFHDAAQRTGQTLAVRVEIEFGLGTKSEQQSGRHLADHFLKGCNDALPP